MFLKNPFFVKLPKKIKSILRKFSMKNRNFLWNHLKKLKFFENFPWKIDFLWNCLKKTKILRKFALKNRNFLWNHLKNSKFFKNLPLKINFFVCEVAWKNPNFRKFSYKIEIFWSGSTTPQISNQIDAADFLNILIFITNHTSDTSSF